MKRVYLVAVALLLTLCFSERSLHAQESVDFNLHEFRLGAAWRPFLADLTLGTNMDISEWNIGVRMPVSATGSEFCVFAMYLCMVSCILRQ